MNRQSSTERFFIIDFDSTFVKSETIDVLAEEALKGNPKKEEILKKVKKITADGMGGKITLSESFKRRFALFSANKKQVKELTEFLKTHVTVSILRNKEFFKKNAPNIYIVSGGFKECIVPVVKEFGISPSHVLANELRFSKSEKVIGVASGPLSKNRGKTLAVKALKLKGEVIMIGDGITDYEVKAAGAAHKFFGFTENVLRENIIDKADAVIGSFDELLYLFNMPRSVSYPKSRLKVLLLENIHPYATEFFKKNGYKVETVSRALSEQELKEKIEDVAILGIRSTTQVTKAVLENTPRLLSIGAFCIGTNQIDLKAAAEKGIAVFNAPFSNGRSVVELTIGLIIMLSRHVFEKSTALQRGGWDKSAKGSHEIRGKTLGIIGYGNIGTQLSVAAESLGMNVIFYDVVERPAISNALRAETLEELLAESDVVTLHIDGRSLNKHFIGENAFKLMKKGSLFLNISRGSVVDIEALAQALKTGHLGGAAIDVFPDEPKENGAVFKSSLQDIPNVILTPHIGGSTEEAQESIARFMSQKIDSFIDTGGTMLSVNMPNLQLPVLNQAHRFALIHKNVPGVLAKINTLMGEKGVNILGQYLGTGDEVGYVITDVAAEHTPEIKDELSAMPETIKLRILY